MMQHEYSSSMISSADVNGAKVYNYDKEHVGEIDHLVIDKSSGKIAYAVMSFGGFLGIGEDHHPIPWTSLNYDTDKNGYVTNISKEQLETAPKSRSGWDADQAWRERTYRHYGATPYWM